MIISALVLVCSVGLCAQGGGQGGAQAGGGGRGQGGGRGAGGGGGGRGGQANADGRWVRLAPIPEMNEERNGVVANGNLYLFGGNPVGMTGTPPGAVWEYDAAGDKWTKKKNMPLAAHHVAVAENGGKIYVFGGGVQKQAGGSAWVPANNAWEYDPAADTWKALAAMPTARLAAVAVAAGGKIYVMGGAGNFPSKEGQALDPNTAHRVFDLNQAYDPATNSRTTKQTMPTPRSSMFAGVVGGKIYLIGGRLASAFATTGSATDIVEEYDPATNHWGFLKDRMPTPRDEGVSGVYNNKIYVAGGESVTGLNNSVSRAFEAYDPAANSWRELGNMPLARYGVAGGMIGNRMLIVGGHITAAFGGGEPLNTAQQDAFEFAAR
jgi:N-acetylneuraminic acid mutarotase